MKVLIDNGHGIDTKGKHSPDNPPSLWEYRYAREIAAEVVKRLQMRGVDASLVTPETTDVPIRNRLARINAVCDRAGAKNVLLVSIHNNATGNDGKWHDARGFSVFVAKNSSARSKLCASIFTELAIERGLTGNRSIPREKYWTWSWTKYDIGILRGSKCPAVLTENLFQDNREDVAFLLSAEGREKVTALHVDAILRYIESHG